MAEMTEKRRKALALPKPRKPTKEQMEAHYRYCHSFKSGVIPPDRPPNAQRAINDKLRDR